MMSYDPKLHRDVADKVFAFLRNTYRERGEFLAAVDEFRLALLNLGANPRQAVGPPGPFETRPVFRFILKADGIEREVQICFCYDSDDVAERTILITDFAPVDS